MKTYSTKNLGDIHNVSATFSEKLKFLLDVDYEEAYDLTMEECEALFTQKIISHFKTLCNLPTEETIGNNDSRNAAH